VGAIILSMRNWSRFGHLRDAAGSGRGITAMGARAGTAKGSRYANCALWRQLHQSDWGQQRATTRGTKTQRDERNKEQKEGCEEKGIESSWEEKKCRSASKRIVSPESFSHGVEKVKSFIILKPGNEPKFARPISKPSSFSIFCYKPIAKMFAKTALWINDH